MDLSGQKIEVIKRNNNIEKMGTSSFILSKTMLELVCKIGSDFVAYIKYKELTKYFDFREEIEIDKLPDYTKEYVNDGEKILLGYKTTRDHAVFTDKTMILFDRNVLGSNKKIHIIPYASISTSAIYFKPGKTEILISLDSGYQMRIVFVNMNHDKKEHLKEVYKVMMKNSVKA